jgi:hypothetical protein
MRSKAGANAPAPFLRRIHHVVDAPSSLLYQSTVCCIARLLEHGRGMSQRDRRRVRQFAFSRLQPHKADGNTRDAIPALLGAAIMNIPYFAL